MAGRGLCGAYAEPQGGRKKAATEAQDSEIHVPLSVDMG